MIAGKHNPVILSCSKDCLTLSTQNHGRMTYKQYKQIPKRVFSKINQWSEISHPCLLAVYQTHKIQDHSTSLSLGLYAEYYSATLAEFQIGNTFDQDQVVNTFQPVLEGLQYLIIQGYQIGNVCLNNIVVTEGQNVKFVDDIVQNPREFVEENLGKQKVFEKLSELIFDFLIPQRKGRNGKTWKSKLQILKKKVRKETFDFFMAIFNRSFLGMSQMQKTKKISKSKIEKKKTFEGKQNQIVQ